MSNEPGTRASLLIRLKSPRNEHAWAEFVELYEPLVHRLARQSGLQAADADDLTQDVFRAVAGAIDRWNPDPVLGSFRGWLVRIARNLIVNLLAARRRQSASYGTGDSDMQALLEAQPAVGSEYSELFDIEYRRRLFSWAAEWAQSHFHESSWQAFWRTAVEGEAVDFVAKALGLTPGAVYVVRSRVMARIRQEIDTVEGTA